MTGEDDEQLDLHAFRLNLFVNEGASEGGRLGLLSRWEGEC